MCKENEIILTKDLENVNQQLINVYKQCEQLQEYNQQLLLEKQIFNENENQINGLFIKFIAFNC